MGRCTLAVNCRPPAPALTVSGRWKQRNRQEAQRYYRGEQGPEDRLRSGSEGCQGRRKAGRRLLDGHEADRGKGLYRDSSQIQSKGNLDIRRCILG